MTSRNQIAELPIGFQGLSSSKNQSQVSIDKLIQAENITYVDGTIQKIGGTSKYNATQLVDGGSAAVKILAGYEWAPIPNTYRQIILTSEGKLLRDTGDGSFATELATGLSVTKDGALFIDAGKELAANNRKLFIFTGTNSIQVLSGDGVTTSAITTPPADWTGSTHPIAAAIHEFRLWAALGHIVYYSTTDDHEDYTGAGSGVVSIYPGEGEEISFIVSFSSRLVVFKKPKGIYIVDTTDPTVANWRVDKVTDGVGCPSNFGFELLDNDLAFLNDVGHVQLASSVDTPGVIRSENLSEKTETDTLIREELSFGANVSKVRMLYYSEKRQLMFALPKLGESENSTILVYEFHLEDSSVKPAIIFRDTPVSLWLRTVGGIQRPVLGDDNGFVWDLDEASKSKDGVGYLGQFQSPHYDLSHIDPKLATINKTGMFLELIAEPLGNWDLTVDIYWDDELVVTKTFNMGITGAALGSFTLDTDALGGNQVVNRKRKIEGQGRRISFVGRNSGIGQDFSIAKFYLHFMVNEESLR